MDNSNKSAPATMVGALGFSPSQDEEWKIRELERFASPGEGLDLDGAGASAAGCLSAVRQRDDEQPPADHEHDHGPDAHCPVCVKTGTAISANLLDRVAEGLHRDRDPAALLLAREVLRSVAAELRRWRP